MKALLAEGEAREKLGVTSRPIRWPELAFATASVAALIWINLYICRDLVSVQTTAMNSMHGFGAAISKWADGSWFTANGGVIGTAVFLSNSHTRH